MKSNLRNILIVVATVAASGFAVVRLIQFVSPAPHDARPDGVTYVCESCKAEVAKTLDEWFQYAEEHADAPDIPCPKCNAMKLKRVPAGGGGGR